MDNNYMKTILSGVKEWTENLTDDAIDKANNALDKALFVVNITQNSDGTLSADKTFEEIVQAYNEGKYNIVAHIMGIYIMPLLAIISNHAVKFSTELNQGGYYVVSAIIAIAPDNSIQMIQTPLATTNSKLPNPYSLTFTGAVNETYDGARANTIEIPSGGGGEKEWTVLVDQELSAETPGYFSITGLNNFTEFYAEWDALQHGTNNTTNSGMQFWINDIQVSASPSFCPVYAPSNKPVYGWTMAKYNGIRWLLAKSQGSTSKEKTQITSQMITQYYPPDINAPATKVYVGGSGDYAAVSGHFRLWGR